MDQEESLMFSKSNEDNINNTLQKTHLNATEINKIKDKLFDNYIKSSWEKSGDFSFDFDNYAMQLTDEDRAGAKDLYVGYKNKNNKNTIDIYGAAWGSDIKIIFQSKNYSLINEILKSCAEIKGLEGKLKNGKIVTEHTVGHTITALFSTSRGKEIYDFLNQLKNLAVISESTIKDILDCTNINISAESNFSIKYSRK